jgi:hypothetical protein
MNAFYALLALQVLDLLSTVIALRNPKLTEANGPLAGLMKSIGTLPALMCIKTTAMVLIWHHREDMGNWLIALCVLYAVVITNNIRLIRGAK